VQTAFLLCAGASAIGLLIGQASSTGPAQQNAIRVLERARAAAARLGSLEARFQHRNAGHSVRGRLLWRRPNLARIEVEGPSPSLIVSDGNRLYHYLPDKQEYQTTPATPDGRGIRTQLLPQLDAFYAPRSALSIPAGARASLHREKWEGVEFDVVEVAQTDRTVARGKARGRRSRSPRGLPVPRRVDRYYIGRQDSLVYRIVQLQTSGPGPGIQSSTVLREVRRDENPDPARFRWSPPPGARETFAYSGGVPAAPAVPIGQIAPNFSLPTPDGLLIVLSEVAKRSRATVLTFWFYG